MSSATSLVSQILARGYTAISWFQDTCCLLLNTKTRKILCSFSLTMSEKKKTAMIDSTQGKSTSCIQRHAFNCNVFLLGRCWHKERALKKNENIQTMVKLDEIRSWEMKSFNKTSLQIQFGCWKVINQLLPSDPLMTQMEVTNNPWKGHSNPQCPGSLGRTA